MSGRIGRGGVAGRLEGEGGGGQQGGTAGQLLGSAKGPSGPF